MPAGRPLTPITLTDDERLTLSTWSRRPTTAQRIALRAKIILAAAGGRSNIAIATDLRVPVDTVGRWRRRFLDRRLEGLTDSPQSGAPRALVDEPRLQELVHKAPRLFGKNRSTWTLQLLADTCNATGITRSRICASTIRRTLKRMGVKWRRAELWMTSPDPHYAEKKARR